LGQFRALPELVHHSGVDPEDGARTEGSIAEEISQLMVEQLKEPHSAETQMLRAMPRMARQATSRTLKEALEAHLEQTDGQVEKLERALEVMGVKRG
jgi:ferritin-like metal-binding protein YciE